MAFSTTVWSRFHTVAGHLVDHLGVTSEGQEASCSRMCNALCLANDDAVDDGSDHHGQGHIHNLAGGECRDITCVFQWCENLNLEAMARNEIGQWPTACTKTSNRSHLKATKSCRKGPKPTVVKTWATDKGVPLESGAPRPSAGDLSDLLWEKACMNWA